MQTIKITIKCEKPASVVLTEKKVDKKKTPLEKLQELFNFARDQTVIRRE